MLLISNQSEVLPTSDHSEGVTDELSVWGCYWLGISLRVLPTSDQSECVTD